MNNHSKQWKAVRLAVSLGFIVLTSLSAQDILITNGATWRFFNTASAPASNWTDRTFADAGWSNGFAPLGYSVTGVVTTLSYGGNATNKWPCYYFRKSFVVTNAVAVPGLTARFTVDDAAAIYINGSLVYVSTNLAQPLSHTNRANPSVPEPYVPVECEIPAELLVEGTNVLAVEVHQAAPTSTDLYWDLRLTQDSIWTPYTLETTPNTLNLAQFPDEQLPTNHYSVLGYGFPNFSDEPRSPILKLLTIGHTHMGNDGAFPDSNVLASCHYGFENVPAMVTWAAEKIIADGAYIPGYGDFSGVTNYGKDFSGITRDGALEIGRYMHIIRNLSWSPSTATWSRPTDNGTWIMMDEEEYFWSSPENTSQFVGWLMEGHAMEAPNKKIGFYGHPVTWLMIADQSYQDMTDGEVEEFLENDRAYGFESNSWLNAGPYIDLSAGYFKIPYIETNSLYMKDGNGAYVTNVSGAREWRTDTFQEVIFGHTNTIWSEPEPDLRNYQANDLGQGLVDPVLQPGYHWASWCGHDPNPLWEPEVKLMVKGIYAYADYILLSKMMLNKADFGDMDISYWRDNRLKTYVERRPRTEPWTWGGNTRWIRELGATALKYNVMFAYLAGVNAVSTWDNGGFVSEESIKPYGSNVFSQAEFLPSIPNDENTARPDNYSRYVVWSAAVNSFARLMKGIPVDSTLKYIRFYYPVVGARNKEVISSGVYSGSKFIVMFNYPLLDPDEELPLTIRAGSLEYNTVLKGRDLQLLHLTVPEGLEPRDFELHYTNIEGRKVAVNGLITGSVAEHYAIAEHSSGWTAYNDMAWSTGQTNYRITRYSFVTNDTDHRQNGQLIQYANGEEAAVSVSLTGEPNAEFATAVVPPPDTGTPADVIFSGKADMSRSMSLFENETGSIRLSGMDPDRRYKVILFGNRANVTYTNRKTIVTLVGADAFTNASSSGAVITASNTTTSITTGTNTGGLLFVYTGINPGSDGSVQLTISGPTNQKCYLNTMAVELLPLPIVDTDTDGMDDSWEALHFGGVSQSNGGATEDWDGDGFDNYSEYRAGTDPAAPASRLLVMGLTGTTNTGSMAVLSWSSVTGKTYSILQSTNMASAHVSLHSGITATPPLNVFTATMSGTRGFLSIKVE